jgi:predicted DNA binding CopG/RHH family protein
MSDAEFDAYTDRLFGEPRVGMRSVTVRMPEDLLIRLQRIAADRHVPYQRLMKRILEESVRGLERRNPKASPTRSRSRPPTARTQ